MSEQRRKVEASRIVVVMPNWLGDAVMATPFLRTLRAVYPEAGGERIAAVVRQSVAPVCQGLVDELKAYGKGEEGAVARWMRSQKFELGILLPNSFRSAWMLWRGGVKRRLGYARGGRSWLLTDRLAPLRRSASRRTDDARRAEVISELGGGRVKVGSGYEPVATIDYYLELAKYLGAAQTPRRMELHVSDAEQREGQAALAELGMVRQEREISDLRSQISDYAIIVPGANFGASKCWEPSRFAQVAEQFADPTGDFRLRVLLVGSPAETPICQAILAAMPRHRQRVAILGQANAGRGISVGGLKQVVRHAQLMLCNDTGPRHLAVAFGVPVVTLFGPTDPVWAETFCKNERLVRIEVPCGPCQLKQCPIDHRCMTGVTVEMVLEAVRELWKGENRNSKTAV